MAMYQIGLNTEIMAWHRKGAKPRPESTVTQFAGTYKRYQAPMG